MKVTKEWLRAQVEQAEPSDDGEWFVLDLATVTKMGFGYLEIHFDDLALNPNSVRLSREDGS